MDKLVIALLYVVMACSLAFAAFTVYLLVVLWDGKVLIGVVRRDVLYALCAIIFGVALPHCMVKFIRRK